MRDQAAGFGPFYEYPVADTAFHFVILMLLWLQSSCFERVEYAFVMHYLFRLSQLGEGAAQILRRRRVEAIVVANSRFQNDWASLQKAVSAVEARCRGQAREFSNMPPTPHHYFPQPHSQHVVAIAMPPLAADPRSAHSRSVSEISAGQVTPGAAAPAPHPTHHARVLSGISVGSRPDAAASAGGSAATGAATAGAAAGDAPAGLSGRIERLVRRVTLWLQGLSDFDENTWAEVVQAQQEQQAQRHDSIHHSPQRQPHHHRPAEIAVPSPTRRAATGDDDRNKDDGAASAVAPTSSFAALGHADSERPFGRPPPEAHSTAAGDGTDAAGAATAAADASTTDGLTGRQRSRTASIATAAVAAAVVARGEETLFDRSAGLSSLVGAMLRAFGYYALSQLDCICYGGFAIQFAIAPCILNAVLPILSFAYAAVIAPRPHRMFWNLALLYLQVCIVAKSLVKVFECESDGHFSWATGRICLSGSYFVTDLFLSLGCVVLMLLHKANLVAWGLWDNSDIEATWVREHIAACEAERAAAELEARAQQQQRQQLQGGNGSRNSNLAASCESLPLPELGATRRGDDAAGENNNNNNGINGSPTRVHQQPHLPPSRPSGLGAAPASFRPPDADAHPLSVTGLAGEVRHFFATCADNIGSHDIKPGGDTYGPAVAAELLSIVVLFFGYFRLMGEEDSIVSSLSGSLLPGTLTICILLLFFMVVVDRVVYLLRSLWFKYVLTVLSAVVYSSVMLAWFHAQSTFDRSYYGTSPFWLRGALPLAASLYLLKMFYVYMSCRQIASGLPAYENHICFVGTCSLIEQFRYILSRITPFAFDLRVLLDWTVSPTVLKMNQWIRVEDIAHELYMTICDVDDTKDVNEMKKKPTDPFPRWLKYVVGSITFSLVALVLLGPLLLYSSVSPVVQKNSVSEISVVVSLPNLPPLWQTQQAVEGSDLNGTVVSLLEKTRQSLLSLEYSQNTVQFLQFTSFSNSLWTVSADTVEQTSYRLRHSPSVALTLDISILSRSSRTAGSSLAGSQILTQSRVLAPAEIDAFVAVINGSASSATIERMFNPFLSSKGSNFLVVAKSSYISCTFNRIAANINNPPANASQPRPPGGGGLLPNASSYFELRCRTLFDRSNPTTYVGWNDLSPPEWNCLRGTARCPNEELTAGGNGTAGLYFVVESSQSLSVGFLQTIGIVAAYSTFVLAVGRVLRFIFSGMAFKVGIEAIENPRPLIDVVQLMYMARARGEFHTEHRAYTCLVDTLRQAELLMRVTSKNK